MEEKNSVFDFNSDEFDKGGTMNKNMPLAVTLLTNGAKTFLCNLLHFEHIYISTTLSANSLNNTLKVLNLISYYELL